MARPGHAARRRERFEDRRLENPQVAHLDANRLQPTRLQATHLDATRLEAGRFDATRAEHLHDPRPTLPSRIGASGRPRRPGVRKAADGLLLWRVLGVSAAALIIGMGSLLAYQLVAPGGAPRLLAAAPPAAAPANSAPRRLGEGGHAQAAVRVASILGAAGAEPASVSPASAPPASAMRVAIATPDGSAEPAPTAADFARPAFLEPLDGAAADTEEESADGAGPRAQAALQDGVPLPTPKPARMAAAVSDDGKTARIRSSVTLRSGPRRSASAIGTLKAGTQVKLYSCKSWCEVASGDKRGFVYKASVAR